MARIFSIRVNIDDLSASLDVWPTDQERSSWLRGFLVGSRGAALRWQLGTPEADGHAVGVAGYADSLAWKAKQSEAGKRSAVVREEKNGTSNPMGKREQPSNDVRTQIEQPSNDVRTTHEPIQSTNQPVNESTDNPINQSTKEKKESRFAPPSPEEVEEYCRGRGNNIDPQFFVDKNQSNGWMSGKNKIKDWKAVIRTWEANDRKWNPPPVPKQTYNPELDDFGPPPEMPERKRQSQ